MEFKGDTFTITSEEALKLVALRAAVGSLALKDKPDNKVFFMIKEAEQKRYECLRNGGYKVKLKTISLDEEP